MKTKIEQRIGNAIKAFFDDANLSHNNHLVHKTTNDILLLNASTEFAEKAEFLLKILKRVFFFLPATFVLYMLSLVFGILTLFSPPVIGEPRIPYSYMITAFIVSIFATWFGLGDLRKTKHLMIPLSVIIVSFSIGVATGVILNFWENFNKILTSDLYPLCIFPFVLMISVLVRNWTDNREFEQ